jgi:hypothetical protein
VPRSEELAERGCRGRSRRASSGDGGQPDSKMQPQHRFRPTLRLRDGLPHPGRGIPGASKSLPSGLKNTRGSVASLGGHVVAADQPTVPAVGARALGWMQFGHPRPPLSRPSRDAPRRLGRVSSPHGERSARSLPAPHPPLNAAREAGTRLSRIVKPTTTLFLARTMSTGLRLILHRSPADPGPALRRQRRFGCRWLAQEDGRYRMPSALRS